MEAQKFPTGSCLAIQIATAGRSMGEVSESVSTAGSR